MHKKMSKIILWRYFPIISDFVVDSNCGGRPQILDTDNFTMETSETLHNVNFHCYTVRSIIVNGNGLMCFIDELDFAANRFSVLIIALFIGHNIASMYQLHTKSKHNTFGMEIASYYLRYFNEQFYHYSKVKYYE